MMFNRSSLAMAGIVALGLLAETTHANAAPPDAANGERLARRWCAECHIVSVEQTRAKADVPSFSTIASNPDLSAGILTSLLTSPSRVHSKMQDIGLSRGDIADLVAYIAKQKP